ncbi:MAG: hypothetical protein ACREP0_10070 [Rhodanobacteraceae bacterium]
MKPLTWLIAMALLVGLPAAQAQQVLGTASTPPPPPGSALPPPGINEPGAKPVPQSSAAPTSARPQSVPLPDTGIPPSLAPAAREAAGRGDSTDVTRRVDAQGDVIQQTSRGGVVYEEQITPKHGVTQTYKYNSPNGSLVPDPRLGPVQPVYYTLYQWNGPRKAAKPASGASAPAAPLPPPPASSPPGGK